MLVTTELKGFIRRKQHMDAELNNPIKHCSQLFPLPFPFLFKTLQIVKINLRQRISYDSCHVREKQTYSFGRALALSQELGIPGHTPITGTIHSASNYSGNAQILPGCGTLSGALSRKLFILLGRAWKVIIIVLYYSFAN